MSGGIAKAVLTKRRARSEQGTRFRAFSPIFVMAMGIAVTLAGASAQAQTENVCDRQDTVSKPQCQALLDLYEQTGGPDWKNNEGWLDRDLSTWFGVRIEERYIPTVREYEPRVVGLELGSNNLKGVLPANLCDLVGLEVLVLSANPLVAPLPDFSGCSKLRELKLNGVDMYTEFPEEWVYLDKLEVLWLYGGFFTGELPDGIWRMNSLRDVDLSTNLFSGPLPGGFGVLPHLENLNVQYNQFEGPIPKELGFLTNIKILELSDNLFEGEVPRSIGNISDFQDINLINNRCLTSSTQGLSDWLTSRDARWPDGCRDVDGDGIKGGDDRCPYGRSELERDIDQDGCDDLTEDSDNDNDNWGDISDNCNNVFNPLQLDTFNAGLEPDGVGDACDDDWDNDGIVNDEDDCPELFNHLDSDLDGDGIGDECDPEPNSHLVNRDPEGKGCTTVSFDFVWVILLSFVFHLGRLGHRSVSQ